MEQINEIYSKLTDKQKAVIERMEEKDGRAVVFLRKKGDDLSKPVVKLFQDKYFKVITGEKDGRAEIFLYGWIGQFDFLALDGGEEDESLTDIAVVKAIRELEKEFKRIDVRINSPGGFVTDGDPIIAAFRSSPAEIHTYIDGIAASMAADIWLAGDVRHMASNSKLMIHSTMTGEFGTAEDMRAAADRLDKFDKAAIKTFSELTNKPEDEIKPQFYDYKDHWLTAEEALDFGLIEKIDTYQTKQVADNAEVQSLKSLIRTFAEAVEETPEEKTGQNGETPGAELTIEALEEFVRQYKESHENSVSTTLDEGREVEIETEDEKGETLEIAKAKLRLAEIGDGQ